MATIKDMIMDVLCKNGVQQATGVTVEFNDGTKVAIHSDNHPALTRPAEEVKSVKATQSAQGGL